MQRMGSVGKVLMGVSLQGREAELERGLLGALLGVN